MSFFKRIVDFALRNTRRKAAEQALQERDRQDKSIAKLSQNTKSLQDALSRPQLPQARRKTLKAISQTNTEAIKTSKRETERNLQAGRAGEADFIGLHYKYAKDLPDSSARQSYLSCLQNKQLDSMINKTMSFEAAEEEIVDIASFEKQKQWLLDVTKSISKPKIHTLDASLADNNISEYGETFPEIATNLFQKFATNKTPEVIMAIAHAFPEAITQESLTKLVVNGTYNIVESLPQLTAMIQNKDTSAKPFYSSVKQSNIPISQKNTIITAILHHMPLNDAIEEINKDMQDLVTNNQTDQDQEMLLDFITRQTGFDQSTTSKYDTPSLNTLIKIIHKAAQVTPPSKLILQEAIVAAAAITKEKNSSIQETFVSSLCFKEQDNTTNLVANQDNIRLFKDIIDSTIQPRINITSKLFTNIITKIGAQEAKYTIDLFGNDFISNILAENTETTKANNNKIIKSLLSSFSEGATISNIAETTARIDLVSRILKKNIENKIVSIETIQNIPKILSVISRDNFDKKLAIEVFRNIIETAKASDAQQSIECYKEILNCALSQPNAHLLSVLNENDNLQKIYQNLDSRTTLEATSTILLKLHNNDEKLQRISESTNPAEKEELQQQLISKNDEHKLRETAKNLLSQALNPTQYKKSSDAEQKEQIQILERILENCQIKKYSKIIKIVNDQFISKLNTLPNISIAETFFNSLNQKSIITKKESKSNLENKYQYSTYNENIELANKMLHLLVQTEETSPEIGKNKKIQLFTEKIASLIKNTKPEMAANFTEEIQQIIATITPSKSMTKQEKTSLINTLHKSKQGTVNATFDAIPTVSTYSEYDNVVRHRPNINLSGGSYSTGRYNATDNPSRSAYGTGSTYGAGRYNATDNPSRSAYGTGSTYGTGRLDGPSRSSEGAYSTGRYNATDNPSRSAYGTGSSYGAGRLDEPNRAGNTRPNPPQQNTQQTPIQRYQQQRSVHFSQPQQNTQQTPIQRYQQQKSANLNQPPRRGHRSAPPPSDTSSATSKEIDISKILRDTNIARHLSSSGMERTLESIERTNNASHTRFPTPPNTAIPPNRSSDSHNIAESSSSYSSLPPPPSNASSLSRSPSNASNITDSPSTISSANSNSTLTTQSIENIDRMSRLRKQSQSRNAPDALSGLRSMTQARHDQNNTIGRTQSHAEQEASKRQNNKGNISRV